MSGALTTPPIAEGVMDPVKSRRGEALIEE